MPRRLGRFQPHVPAHLNGPTQSGRAETEIEALEKAASLRDGIKSDLVDLSWENPGMNGLDLSNRIIIFSIGEPLGQNRLVMLEMAT